MLAVQQRAPFTGSCISARDCEDDSTIIELDRCNPCMASVVDAPPPKYGGAAALLERIRRAAMGMTPTVARPKTTGRLGGPLDPEPIPFGFSLQSNVLNRAFIAADSSGSDMLGDATMRPLNAAQDILYFVPVTGGGFNIRSGVGRWLAADLNPIYIGAGLYLYTTSTTQSGGLIVNLDTAMAGSSPRGSGEWRELRYSDSTSYKWLSTYAWDPAAQTEAPIWGVTAADSWAQFQLTRLPVSFKSSLGQLLSASTTGGFAPITTTSLSDAEKLTVEVNADGTIYLRTKYNTYLNVSATGVFSLVSTPGGNSIIVLQPQGGSNVLFKFLVAGMYMGSSAAGTLYFSAISGAANQVFTLVYSL